MYQIEKKKKKRGEKKKSSEKGLELLLSREKEKAIISKENK